MAETKDKYGIAELESADIEDPTLRYVPLQAEGEEQDVPFSFSKAWELSRDLDSSVGAAARYNHERTYEFDPSFSLTDHLDEFNADVPEYYRNDLNERLADRALSYEHAQWLKGRYLEEKAQEVELVKMGLPGIITRFGVNMFDEGAVALGVATGPIGAAAYKAKRLKAALASGALAGVENMALEAFLAKGSVSRGIEDILYAGAFGAALGGGFGAAFANAPKSSSLGAAAEEMVDSGTRALDQIDQAVASELRGEPVPDVPPQPAREILEQESEQLEESIVAGVAEEPAPDVQGTDKEDNLLRSDERELASSLIKDADVVISRALDDASRGVIVGAQTRIDWAFDLTDLDSRRDYVEDGLAPHGQKIYDLFAPLREKLRQRHGDTITLGRAESPEVDNIPNKHTLNFASVENAQRIWGEQFYRGEREVFTKEVDVADIVAVNLDSDGYEEFIVLNRQSEGFYDPTPLGTELRDIDARIEELGNLRIDEPVSSPVYDMFDEIGDEISFIEDIRAGKVELSQKDKSKADSEFGKAKRELLREYQKADPDGYKDLFGTKKNPPLEDFKAALPKIGKRLERARKAFEKDKADFDKQVNQFSEELNTLATRKDELLDLRERTAANDAEARSVGAAQALSRDKEDLSKLDDDVVSWFVKYPKAALRNARYDLSAKAARSDSPIIRVLGDMLGEEAVGKEGHALSKVSGTERAETLLKTTEARYHQQANASYDEWAKNRGYGIVAKRGPEPRRQFSEEVTRAVETGEGSPEVLRAAKAWADSVSRVAQMARDAQVRGFDDFDIRPDYVPRIHDYHKLSDAVARFGESKVVELFQMGIRKAQPEIDEELAQKIAKGYVRNVRTRGAGVGSQFLDMGTNSVNYLREALRDLDIDQDGIDYIAGLMSNSGKGTSGGKPSRAKRRLLMDTDVVVRAFDSEDGVEAELNLSDLFVRDAEQLMGHYSRSVGGLAAIAKRTQGTPMHIRSHADYERWKNEALKMHADLGGRPEELQNDIRAIDMMWDRMTCTPLVDPTNIWTIRTRRLRDWNFTRVMNQVAFAQFAEFGNAMGTVGLKETFQHMPAAFTIFKRVKETGKLDNDMAAVIEDMIGLGTDRLNGRVNLKYDADDGTRFFLNDSGLDYGIHEAKMLTAAPMHFLISLQQRMTAIGLMQRFTNIATGSRKATEAQMNRLKGAGIDEKMLGRIVEQLNKHSSTKRGVLTKQKLKNPNLDKWDDLDALDAFTHAIGRLTRRAVQENSIGNTLGWQNSNLGSLVMQFRGFMMVAWAKQLLHGVHHRDMQTFAMFTLSSLFAGTAWAMQVYFNSIGREDQQEYLNERLTIGNVAKAGFQRSAWASLMPMGIDTTRQYLMGQDPMFSFRSTGLSNNPLLGIPSADLLGRTAGALQAPARAAFNSDYSFSAQDLKNWQFMLPFSNLAGLAQAYNALAGELPRRSQQ